MWSYSCFSVSIGRKKFREWSGSLGCDVGVAAGGVAAGDDVVAFGDGVFGFRKKKRKGAQTRGVCCYRYRKIPRGFFAKLPEIERRQMQMLLLLCITKQDR